MKKILAVIMAAVLSVGIVGCHTDRTTENENYKLQIVTTLFPYYDAARAIVGDTKNVKISMTVAPGQDSHSFEPTPADVIEIEKADVFIYNGGSLETWVDTLLDSLNNQGKYRLKMMDYVDLLEEEYVEGMDTRFDSHNDGEHSDGEHDSGQEEDIAENDEHIWTSPVNMQIITQKICEQLCQASPDDAETFQKNAAMYIEQLKELDEKIRTITEKAENKEIIFADKFPILYFAKEYGLKYYAAFSGCGSDMEPSAKTIAFLIKKIRQENIKAVFYLELSSHTVANTISEDTGAEIYQFNSCHNITQKQFDDGVTYIELMEENAKNLEKALN